MTPKPEQIRWASQEAAIKAEINEAKNTRTYLKIPDYCRSAINKE